MPCYFCNSEAPIRNKSCDSKSVDCPLCGNYRITDEAIYILDNDSEYRGNDIAKNRLGAVIRERQDIGQSVGMIATKQLASLLSLAPNQFDVARKARKLLEALKRKTKHAGER